MQLLAWDFTGDAHERMEMFDRAVALYQARTKEVLSDSMKIGIALRQLEEGPLKQHMQMNSARLTAWPNFKQEVMEIKGDGLAGRADGRWSSREGGQARRQRSGA